MFGKRTIEITVGFLMVAGMAALLVLAFKVSGLTTYFSHETYKVDAYFDTIGSLKMRSPVMMAGVRVGQVTDIKLDTESFRAVVTLSIDRKYSKIPSDSSASILTAGLVGSNYVSLMPGFSESFLKEGDEIEVTHPALILENLIGQFLYQVSGDKKKTQ